MQNMPEIRHELDDQQYKELSKLKDKRGLTWKGLMLAGAKELDNSLDVESPEAQRFEGLTYSEDIRVFPDPDDDRLGAFKAGWTEAQQGKRYQSSTLEKLSWHNLGWRLSMLFGDASGELKRDIYMWCVERQQEVAEEKNDDQ
jgi:hypothetical protein